MDVDRESREYGQIVGRVDMPNAGDELHHFGWNACSSALCPYAPHPHVERRYLIVPRIHSSRIHVIDTKNDPKHPKIVKVIEPKDVAERTGYSRPHTIHCGPDGIYLSALGASGQIAGWRRLVGLLLLPMNHNWPWVALVILGAYHGLNPAMGWLFALALGLQEKRRSAVIGALLPIALGTRCRNHAGNSPPAFCSTSSPDEYCEVGSCAISFHAWSLSTFPREPSARCRYESRRQGSVRLVLPHGVCSRSRTHGCTGSNAKPHVLHERGVIEEGLSFLLERSRELRRFVRRYSRVLFPVHKRRSGVLIFAIGGGSHGGTMVNFAVTKLPDTFAAAISLSGVSDRATFLERTNLPSADN